jgi:hypothetical protein
MRIESEDDFIEFSDFDHHDEICNREWPLVGKALLPWICKTFSVRSPSATVIPGSGRSPSDNEGQTVLVQPEKSQKKMRRFFGSAELDPKRAVCDAGGVADAVIQHLELEGRADVKVTGAGERFPETACPPRMCWSARQTARARALTSADAVRARGRERASAGGWDVLILDGESEVIDGKIKAVGLASYSAHIPHTRSVSSSSP